LRATNTLAYSSRVSENKFLPAKYEFSLCKTVSLSSAEWKEQLLTLVSFSSKPLIVVRGCVGRRRRFYVDKSITDFLSVGVIATRECHGHFKMPKNVKCLSMVVLALAFYWHFRRHIRRHFPGIFVPNFACFICKD
jgi:hypothetical protein